MGETLSAIDDNEQSNEVPQRPVDVDVEGSLPLSLLMHSGNIEEFEGK